MPYFHFQPSLIPEWLGSWWPLWNVSFFPFPFGSILTVFSEVSILPECQQPCDLGKKVHLIHSTEEQMLPSTNVAGLTENGAGVWVSFDPQSSCFRAHVIFPSLSCGLPPLQNNVDSSSCFSNYWKEEEGQEWPCQGPLTRWGGPLYFHSLWYT